MRIETRSVSQHYTSFRHKLTKGRNGMYSFNLDSILFFVWYKCKVHLLQK